MTLGGCASSHSRDMGSVSSAWGVIARAEAAAFHATTYPSQASQYGPGFRTVLDGGLSVSGVEYANAAKARAEFTGRLNRFFGDIDCMVCPTMSNPARQKRDDPFAVLDSGGWSRLVERDVHTKPFNLSGNPTLSLPCGFTADELPLSIQFVGPRMGEATICRAGYAFQQATQWHTKHPVL